MSDFSRSKALLWRSARDGLSLSGQGVHATGPAGLERLLDEIGTTVLARRLSIDFDDGARLICEASGRRLMRLLTPAPSGLPAEQLALFDREALAGEDLSVVSDLLLGLCGRSSGFRIAAEPPGDGARTAQGGVSPAAIAAAAGLPGAASDDRDSADHERFLEALGPSLRAACLIEGDEVSRLAGDGAEAAFVSDWIDGALQNLLSAGFPLLGTLETNGILVFALPAAAGRHLLIAGRRGSLLVASVAGSDAAATLACWRHLPDAPLPPRS